jgi:hypothetical protein
LVFYIRNEICVFCTFVLFVVNLLPQKMER